MEYLENLQMAKARMDYMHFWRQSEFKRSCGSLKLSASTSRYEDIKWGYGLLSNNTVEDYLWILTIQKLNVS